MEPMRGNRFRIASKAYRRVRKDGNILWEKEGALYRFEPRFKDMTWQERLWHDGYMKKEGKR